MRARFQTRSLHRNDTQSTMSLMSPSIDRNGAGTHTGCLKPIMLAVLAASITVAWWVSRGGDVIVQRGVDIIQKVRSETLSSYWKSEPVTAAYLVTNREGLNTGWEISIRQATANGYAGAVWVKGKDASRLEEWDVRADASAGEYEARPLLGTRYPPVYIELAYDRVSVRVGGRRTGTVVTNQAPGNYIPVGTFEVVLRLAAKMGHKVAFKTIPIEEPIQGGRVQFRSVTMTPQDPSSVVVDFDRPKHRRVFHLDTDGKIVRIEVPATGTVFKKTSVRELMGRFPEVQSLVAGTM